MASGKAKDPLKSAMSYLTPLSFEGLGKSIAINSATLQMKNIRAPLEMGKAGARDPSEPHGSQGNIRPQGGWHPRCSLNKRKGRLFMESNSRATMGKEEFQRVSYPHPPLVGGWCLRFARFMLNIVFEFSHDAIPLRPETPNNFSFRQRGGPFVFFSP